MLLSKKFILLYDASVYTCIVFCFFFFFLHIFPKSGRLLFDFYICDNLFIYLKMFMIIF